MTAEEYIIENFEVNYADKDIQKAMIEFAQYHVEQALKAASEKALKEEECEGSVHPNTIINAYPLENIK